jgi:hypothetical protein
MHKSNVNEMRKQQERPKGGYALPSLFIETQLYVNWFENITSSFKLPYEYLIKFPNAQSSPL